MGRQTALVASADDEQALLAFLREMADIQLLVGHAQTRAGLFVKQLRPYSPSHRLYYIWNRAFPWRPRVARGQRGVYIDDIAAAPVLELERTNIDWTFGARDHLANGRIYWSSDHMQDEPPYDVAAFALWYDRLTRWIRKAGQRDGSARSPFYLPDAWQMRDCLHGPKKQPRLEASWLKWRDGTLGKVARRIRAEKRFADMPILGDACEEAGCTNPALLEHCRAPGPHVPACWVLDLILKR